MDKWCQQYFATLYLLVIYKTGLEKRKTKHCWTTKMVSSVFFCGLVILQFRPQTILSQMKSVSLAGCSAISAGNWWLSSSTLSQSTNFLTKKYVLLHVKPSFDSWCEERQEMGQRDQGNNTHQMAEAARIWTCSGHKDPDPTTGSPFLKFVFLLNEITQCDYNETCFSKVCSFASLRCSFFSKIFSLL